MTLKPVPVRLYEQGFLPLVSVIPPDAPLSPGSRIPPSVRGKVPGHKKANGTWVGTPTWQQDHPSLDDVKGWAQDGANVGLRAEYYPAIDIDTLAPWLSDEVAAIARRVLGPAPGRVGRAPKQLLLYRTGEPFGRMAVLLHMGKETHLVEVLGRGRQFVVYGQHPSGSAYTWDTDLTETTPDDLTMITAEQVNTFLDELSILEKVPGIRVERVGSRSATREPQGDLAAPSLDALRACVAAIPNTNDLWPERDDYIKVGYAVRAAAGEDEEVGFEIYAEWCDRWDEGENAPDTVREDWRRMHPPYSVGWNWLAEIASRCGFNSAQYEFAVDPVEEVKEEEREVQPEFSDTWCVERVIEDHQHEIRFVPASEQWYVWSGGRWAPDAILLADAKIAKTLRRYAHIVAKQGASDKERAANAKIAHRLSSAKAWRDTRTLLRSDPRITAPIEAFDADPWVLNTPAGMIDLRSGDLSEHRADALCSKQTLVSPDHEMSSPLWDAFLREATGGDVALRGYLQRLIGYGLTGSTREQMFAFLWGPGGNGKGVFLQAIVAIMRDYATAAAIDTFTASESDRHPTDLAGMLGARLVTSNETQSGRRWDEQRVKMITGGDPVRARFMRQDFFTYVPQFTLIFSGNHMPEIRDIDAAMRRRIHMVPFTAVPRVVDTELGVKLREEYPAILAWAIQGCLQWQERGLVPPPVVCEATEEYFEAEDPLSRWIEDRCDEDAEAFTPIAQLYECYREWCGEVGVWAGSQKRLAQLLTTHQYPRQRTKTQRGFRGLRIRDVHQFIEGG